MVANLYKGNNETNRGHIPVISCCTLENPFQCKKLQKEILLLTLYALNTVRKKQTNNFCL